MFFLMADEDVKSVSPIVVELIHQGIDPEYSRENMHVVMNLSFCDANKMVDAGLNLSCRFSWRY